MNDAPSATAETVTVALGDRAYPIVIGAGLIEQAGAHLAPAIGRGRAFVVTDATVAALYLTPFLAALDRAGIAHETITVAPGEASKDLAGFGRVADACLAARIERSDTVVALGGGVVGDLAGFAAATLLRGVGFVQVPTTLLAQVDSSVGGKTGINTAQGKNLLGAFYQPKLVLADTGTLDSLPPRELRAGYAEVVKYGLLGDAGFFEWLEAHGQAVLEGDPAARRHAIRTSCAAKAAVVAADEREGGARALLNLGHTFGHALEAEGGYDGRVLHGEAVAVGMVLAFRLSSALGLCPAEDAARVRAHLARHGLPTAPRELPGLGGVDAAAFVAHMMSDKKVSAGRPTFILARGIGRAFVEPDVDLTRVGETLAAA
jgi:3-dehydroquinate synthase